MGIIELKDVHKVYPLGKVEVPAVKGVWRSWKLFPHALRERRSIQKSRVVELSYIKSIIWPNLPDKNIKRIKNMFIPG